MLLGIVVAFGSATVSAHEFWVEPSTFTLEHGGRIGVHLCVGDGFEGWSLARDGRRIEKFIAAGPAGEQPIVGLDGSDPAGIGRFIAPGGYVIAYRSNHAFQELPADRFEQHLHDKGLERIAELRKQRGEGSRKTREAYSRHAKALIRVGDSRGVVADCQMDLRLELVAEPGLLLEPAGATQRFRLLYQGKPLSGALVAAARLGTADDDLRTRTDADGRAKFVLRAPGVWRITAVHMIEAPSDVAAEWESLWASLTFELPAPSGGAARDSGARTGAACRNRVIAPALQVRQ